MSTKGPEFGEHVDDEKNIKKLIEEISRTQYIPLDGHPGEDRGEEEYIPIQEIRRRNVVADTQDIVRKEIIDGWKQQPPKETTEESPHQRAQISERRQKAKLLEKMEKFDRKIKKLKIFLHSSSEFRTALASFEGRNIKPVLIIQSIFPTLPNCTVTQDLTFYTIQEETYTEAEVLEVFTHFQESQQKTKEGKQTLSFPATETVPGIQFVPRLQESIKQEIEKHLQNIFSKVFPHLVETNAISVLANDTFANTEWWHETENILEKFDQLSENIVQLLQSVLSLFPDNPREIIEKAVSEYNPHIQLDREGLQSLIELSKMTLIRYFFRERNLFTLPTNQRISPYFLVEKNTILRPGENIQEVMRKYIERAIENTIKGLLDLSEES